MSVQDDLPISWGLPFKFTTAALSTSTASAGDLTGAGICVMNNSGANPGNYTTRTATQMIADESLYLGQSWLIVLVNGQGTGNMGLVAGSGVTLSGGSIVFVVQARVYIAKVTNMAIPAITITNRFSLTATALAFGA